MEVAHSTTVMVRMTKRSKKDQIRILKKLLLIFLPKLRRQTRSITVPFLSVSLICRLVNSAIHFPEQMVVVTFSL